jgi:hypothetical protein
MYGIGHAIPWPIPPQTPGALIISFWGSGDQTTEPFVLHEDAALRIAIEQGVLLMRVLCPDGSELGHQTTMPGPGLAMDDIPVGGSFLLEVRASGRWGVTLITGQNPGGAKRWWRFW